VFTKGTPPPARTASDADLAEEAAALVAIAELDWLKKNPAFTERPASLLEFLGPDYLNIADGVREGVREALTEIFGAEPNVYNLANVQRAMFTGAIGVGKTTFASIALPYMAHWVLCLKDPQKFFGLLPGSRIAFMQMSTSETNAREVLFGDIFARINHSPWFRKHPHDPSYKRQIRLPKDIWIVPGDSKDTTFEGYNILGGIIDEMDSHLVTEKKDYALDGYNTIRNRITSRFGNRGLLILIGQMKKSIGFAANMYREFLEDGKEGGSYATKLTIWDSLGWDKFSKDDGTRDSFWFDPARKQIVDELMRDFMTPDQLMEIPNVYRKDFTSNPQQALRDHAGIPPMVGDAFISMPEKVEAAVTKWHTRHGVSEGPVGPRLNRPEFADWFVATDSLKRVAHVDIGISPDGDALGIAVGHIHELKEVDDELKPVIVFDCLIRIRPLPGEEILLSDMREILYRLKDTRNFNIKQVTLDGFQSSDTLQQLNKKKFNATYLSVDKELLPYHDLREAIYEDRIEWPRLMTYWHNGDTKLIDIITKELLELVYAGDGKKIDHPVGGSKDVADAMAGVVCTLMGGRQYRRGVTQSGGSIGSGGSDVPFPHLPRENSGSGLELPEIPSFGSLPGFGSIGSGASLPPHLRPGVGSDAAR